ncbi:MAG: FAD-dependent oxidoreductase [Rhodospirillales bacterium]|nr:FAD-dependent oxidoreductase [Rhodospirillales bacterium]
MQYVILGAGPAGVIAAETLRKLDPGGTVTLVGGEPEPPYSRMAIPYVLTGKIDEKGTYLRKTAGHYDSLGITYVQGKAEKVDPVKGTVTLRGGDSLSYDRLLVATGSSPVKPPVPGLDLSGVHHCWTLEDARNIAARAVKGSDVVLMGAGFIGCIILESLVERGVNLTVVEAEDRMVPRMMDRTGGTMIKRWCEDKGVTVLTSTKVMEVVESGSGLKIALDNGSALNAALLVVAAGVKPNTDFLEGSGIETDVGIKVDDSLCSNKKNIFAAGDVAQGPDFSGGWSVHAIQPTAVEHGRIAALNMTGSEAVYQGSLNMNVLDTIGLISCSFGEWEGGADGEVVEVVDEENFKYIRLAFNGSFLVGALSLGRTDHVGVLRGLIQSQINLGAWKERLKADPHRIADAYIACTQS